MTSTSTPTSTREHLQTVYNFLTQIVQDESNEDGEPDWRDFSTEGTLKFMHAWNQLYEPFYKNARDLIMMQMADEGASEWIQGDYTATVKDSTKYDPRTLEMLFEHVSEKELEGKGAFKWERKWSATKFKPFGKRGGRIQNIIDNAKSVYQSLNITRQEN